MLHKTAALPQIDFDTHYRLFCEDPSRAESLIACAYASPTRLQVGFVTLPPDTQLTYFRLNYGDVPKQTVASTLARSPEGVVILKNFIDMYPQYSVALLEKEPGCLSLGGALACHDVALLVRCLSNFTKENGDPDAAAVTAVLMQSNERFGSIGAYLATNHLPKFLGILDRNFARMTSTNLCDFLVMLPPKELFDFLGKSIPKNRFTVLGAFVTTNEPKLQEVFARLSENQALWNTVGALMQRSAPVIYDLYFQPPPLPEMSFSGFFSI